MRAGTILGILEGIARGLEDRSVSGVVKKPTTTRGAARSTSTSQREETRPAETNDSRERVREQVLKVYGDAVKALDVQAVFTGFEAGAGTGTGTEWTGIQSGQEARETAEAQLGRKGDAVVAEWEGRVAVPRWEENMEALEMKEKEKSQSQSQSQTRGEGEGAKGAAEERS